MSDLTRFRDHCRRMSTAKHRPDCEHPVAVSSTWGYAEDDLDKTELIEFPAPPMCPGCVTKEARILWKLLADEADRYVTNQHNLGSTA